MTFLKLVQQKLITFLSFMQEGLVLLLKLTQGGLSGGCITGYYIRNNLLPKFEKNYSN